MYRNPDLEPSPWCYTTDPTVRYALCDVPWCPGKFKINTYLTRMLVVSQKPYIH